MFKITANKKTLAVVRTPRRAIMAVSMAYEGRRNEKHIAMYQKWIDEHYKTSKRMSYAIGETGSGLFVSVDYIPDEMMETA